MTKHSWPSRFALSALVLWGVIHIAGGASLLVAETADGLETLGPNSTDSVPMDPGDTTAGLLHFHSLNIALGGLAVLAVAVAWHRQRHRWQFNVALAIAVGLDIGLVAFFVIPGTLPPSQGLIGPALVVVAAIGVLTAGQKSTPAANPS